ncbi:MAG: hypothetical protein HEP71_03145 [Roseivirga sp.]|nr:hypothetical protein [Roseivirga sp.]
MDKGIQLTSATFAKPKVQPLQLLKGIANIIKDVGTAATGGLAGLPADIIDTIAAIKLEDKPETIGWKLISRSLVDAIVTLVSETGRGFLKEEIETSNLDKDLNKFLEKQEYFINRTFLKDPESLKLLEDIQPVLDEFLEIFGFNGAERKNLLERLGRYFLASLIAEWRTNVQYYAVLKSVLETPFDEAEQRASEWHVYGNHLITQIHKPVFSESFGLAQIYIPLRGEYKVRNKQEVKSKEEQEELHGRGDGKFTRYAVDIEKHLLKWIKKGDRKDTLRIVRGGPGNGKSSFLKMLAVRLVEENKRVLFIPLHRLDLEGKLDATVNNYLRYDKFLSHDPINDDDSPLVLIFDGLDELAMQGKALTEIARSFIREVERCLSGYNQVRLKLQVIISGRDVIIQQNESEFRQDGQVLKLLPYFLTDQEQVGLKGMRKLIAQDQRHDWWKRYGELKGKGYNELPENLMTRELDEVTAQPLLNFLVAMSYDRGKIALGEKTNLNEVYADLLKAVYERHYEEGNRHKSLHNLKEEHFGLVLQEIAVSAWHGAGRTTTVKDIQQHFEESGLMSIMEAFIQDAEQGVVSLLAAFYFRQAGQNTHGSQTFEFTHKSFGEYLTAKRIVGLIVELKEDLTEYEGDIRKRKGKNERACLVEWVKMFGERELDDDLIKFIRNELRWMHSQKNEQVSELHQFVIKLINHLLREGIPLERLSPRKDTFMIENEWSINAEKGLWVLRSLLASTTKRLSMIHWPSTFSFREWINRVKNRRFTEWQLMRGFYDQIDLENQDLETQAFFNINFCKSNLAYSNLFSTVFASANLTKANLEEADLWRANLEVANLEGANLKGANLKGANLRGANLEGADLRGAKLDGANFIGANIEGAKWDKGALEKLKRNGQI